MAEDRIALAACATLLEVAAKVVEEAAVVVLL
jgi:hypothetical protein